MRASVEEFQRAYQAGTAPRSGSSTRQQPAGSIDRIPLCAESCYLDRRTGSGSPCRRQRANAFRAVQGGVSGVRPADSVPDPHVRVPGLDPARVRGPRELSDSRAAGPALCRGARGSGRRAAPLSARPPPYARRVPANRAARRSLRPGRARASAGSAGSSSRSTRAASSASAPRTASRTSRSSPVYVPRTSSRTAGASRSAGGFGSSRGGGGPAYSPRSSSGAARVTAVTAARALPTVALREEAAAVRRRGPPARPTAVAARVPAGRSGVPAAARAHLEAPAAARAHPEVPGAARPRPLPGTARRVRRPAGKRAAILGLSLGSGRPAGRPWGLRSVEPDSVPLSFFPPARPEGEDRDCTEASSDRHRSGTRRCLGACARDPLSGAGRAGRYGRCRKRLVEDLLGKRPSDPRRPSAGRSAARIRGLCRAAEPARGQPGRARPRR